MHLPHGTFIKTTASIISEDLDFVTSLVCVRALWDLTQFQLPKSENKM